MHISSLITSSDVQNVTSFFFIVQRGHELSLVLGDSIYFYTWWRNGFTPTRSGCAVRAGLKAFLRGREIIQTSVVSRTGFDATQTTTVVFAYNLLSFLSLGNFRTVRMPANLVGLISMFIFIEPSSADSSLLFSTIFVHLFGLFTEELCRTRTWREQMSFFPIRTSCSIRRYGYECPNMECRDRAMSKSFERT